MAKSDDIRSAELQLHESVALLELLQGAIPAAHMQGLGASKFAFRVDIAIREALPKIQEALTLLDRPADDETAAVESDDEAQSEDEDDEDEPTAKDMLNDAWYIVHGIEQVAAMLRDHDGDADVMHGAAFTIKEAAERAYTLIDGAKELIREGGAA